MAKRQLIWYRLKKHMAELIRLRPRRQKVIETIKESIT